MSTNQKVTVLTTHGRRQNISVTPNTTLLQILEQVCQKHSFKSNEHGLKHHNKVQDLSLTFRFSGLPNNCLLEMFETEKPRDEDGDVVLCVQLENGERHQGEFKSHHSVEFILNSLCKNQFSAMEHPIVFYMRQEIYGEAIRTTNLKVLGITNGRAIVRLLNKRPEELKTQANVYVPPTVKPVVKENDDIKKSPEKQAGSPEIDVKEVVKAIKPIGEEKIGSDLKNNEKTNENIENKLVKIDDIKENIKPAYKWEDSEGRSMVSKEKAESSTRNIVDFEEPVIYELGERNAVVFSLDATQKLPEEIPDSFFELTTTDLRLLLRDLKKEASGTDEAPLLTAKLRELEESKKILRKMEQYKYCVIRIKFPERLVLQGTFRPTESVMDIHNFLKQFLKNPNIKFHLFTIPPKKVLPTDKTLLEVDCVPTAILHFGADDTDEEKFLLDNLYSKLTNSNGALLSATKSRGLLSQKTKDCKEESPPLPNEEIVDRQEQPQSTGTIPKKPKNEDFKESKSASSTSGLVPKWFKPNKK